MRGNSKRRRCLTFSLGRAVAISPSSTVPSAGVGGGQTGRPSQLRSSSGKAIGTQLAAQGMGFIPPSFPSQATAARAMAANASGVVMAVTHLSVFEQDDCVLTGTIADAKPSPCVLICAPSVGPTVTNAGLA